MRRVWELQDITGVSVQDPLLDSQAESPFVYEDPAAHTPVSESWSEAPLPIHARDSTSRVISFVLGFALASLIAWLGSIGTAAVVVAPIEERVAAAVTPVVAPTTESEISGITEASGSEPVAPLARPARQDALQLPSRPTVQGYRGGLALSSSPAGAQVLMNGKVVGQTPVVLSDLPVGSRALLVRRDGYSSWSASVRIVANQRTIVNATLVPAPRTGG